MAARVGRSIHAEIPPAAAAFLAAQRLVFLGTADLAGRVWATALAGPPGFAHALDARTVRLAAQPGAGDPLHVLAGTAGSAAAHDGPTRSQRGSPGSVPHGDPLRVDGPSGERASGDGVLVGVLAVDFSARRRLRLNGRVRCAADGALELHADQVYANCPKYIQARHVIDAADGPESPASHDAPGRAARAAAPGASARRWGTALTDAQRALVEAADTFVIATRHPGAGADCSHRGGLPGFVAVERSAGRDGRTVDRLTLPDYAGNAMFNTLGNLAADPRAGLLFVDFARGTLLHITGRAATDWDPAHAAARPGAERLVTFAVEHVLERPHALPLHFRFGGYSPFNPPARGTPS
jgi:predicted pyridoxine 5'-phosphate oxidase superfamily flavin-nucleotide-binding protein